MEQFIYGLFGVLVGLAMVKYTKPIYSFTGKFAWAEKFFGIGGTITALKLIGIIIIFLSATYAFGLIGGEFGKQS